MSGNRIFRGPQGREPETVNLPVKTGLLPGVLCTEDGAELIVATASDMREELLVLSNLEFQDQDLATAYTAGDTGVAYRPLPGDVYQVRLANATYAKGAPLTIGASGYLAAVGDEQVIYAYFDDTPGAYAAGALADVRWGFGVTTAPAV